MRIPNWTKMSAEQLWEAWRADFDTDDAAIAQAVWQANRMIKPSARQTKRKFYSIKNEFIRRYGRTGQRVRLDQYDCRYCNGENDWCRNCGGDGIYRQSWLYLHEFEVDGQTYRLHSYVEPKVLVANVVSFGHEGDFGDRFTEEEKALLPLPVSGLVQLLGYVAAAMWKMQWNGVSYEPMSGRESAPKPVKQIDVRHFWVGATSGG